MKKIMLKLLSLAAVATLTMAATAWANVPPPPANQWLYIYDTTFDKQTRDVCIQCHFDPAKTTAENDTALAIRHHNLVLTKGYECSTCHGITDTNPGANNTQVVTYNLDEFRKCEYCHAKLGTPHHKTPQAVAKNCTYCHGNAIDNPGDGHYIPTNPKSMITPQTAGNIVIDTQTNKPIYIGGCRACHAEDLTAKDPRPFANMTTRPIFGNADTHHGIGLTDCTICHNWPPAPGKPINDIRICQDCHSVRTLHNIQKPNPNKPVAFNEPLGFGHIGNNWDCWGCHGWYDKYTDSALPQDIGSLVPFVNSLSTSLVKAGAPAEITINGVNLVGSLSGVDAAPVVVVGGVTVTPTAVSDTAITFTAPALSAGAYDVVVNKGDKVSNLLKLVVARKIGIKGATITATGMITVSGEGFGPQPPKGLDLNMGVYVNGVKAVISSWSESKIVAKVPSRAAVNKVSVKGLFGPTTEFTATNILKK